MQRLEVSGAVRPIYGSLGVKRLRKHPKVQWEFFFWCVRKIAEKMSVRIKQLGSHYTDFHEI